MISIERLGFWPARMLAQAFRTSDFFMKDPREISKLVVQKRRCLFDERVPRAASTAPLRIKTRAWSASENQRE